MIMIEKAVIFPGSVEERDRLFDYLSDNGIKWCSGDPLSRFREGCDDPEECFHFDINEGVCHGQRVYFQKEASSYQYDGVPFLCSVDEFIQSAEGILDESIDNSDVDISFLMK